MNETGNTSVGPDPSRSVPASPRRRVVRSIAIVLGVVVGVGILLGTVVALWLNSSLSNISRVDVTLPEAARPEVGVEGATNVLLLGTDSGLERNGPGASVIEAAAAEHWPAGVYRSDATMLLHIDADRSKVYVISIPRDSYVPVFDGLGEQRQTTKINAALSLYGPSGAIATVENFTGLRIDHLAMTDWDGFTDVTDALGGVKITVKGEGERLMDGEEALAYVRDRFSVHGGDFDRVKRHQNYLRSLMSKMIDRGTLTNPFKLKGTLDAITTNLAVDDGWTSGQIRSLAISLRNVRRDDVVFLTVPTKGTASDPEAGSIVVVDDKASAGLFGAIREDDMDAWLEVNGDTVLGADVD